MSIVLAVGVLLALTSACLGSTADLASGLWCFSSQGLSDLADPSSWPVDAQAVERWGLRDPLASKQDLWSSPELKVDSWLEGPPEFTGSANAKPDGLFYHSWRTVTMFELALLGITASLPRDWTGWSEHFIADGAGNLEDAWTGPPTWDTDWWFHNYVGHPYGGSVYYNMVRSQGASQTESFLFVALMSTQWEYVFEAIAEQPSIQDLIITPVCGWILGELVHNMTLSALENGAGLLETVVLFVLNPMHAIYVGF
jgi:hypothetical protein